MAFLALSKLPPVSSMQHPCRRMLLPASPELASRSTNSVTLKAVTDVNENGAAVEYGISIDGLTWTWQDSQNL